MESKFVKNGIAISLLAIVLAMISITAGASLAKSMFSSLSPEGVTVLRITMSAVILFFGLRVWDVKLTSNNIGSVIAYGITIAGMNLFLYLAIKTIPIGVALAIELIGPLFVSVLFSQKRSDFLWVVLAALGIYLLVPNSTSVSNLDSIGVLYALVAGIFWGGYVIAGKKAGLQHERKAPALGLIVASVFMFPVGIETLPISLIDMDLLILSVFVALLSSAIPLMLEMMALRDLPTKTYGVLTSGEPVVGAIVSFIILGELLTPIQCLGIVTIMIASIGTVMSPLPSNQVIRPQDPLND